MSELGVWAPSAQRVELVTAAGRRPLVSSEDGWWRLPSPALPAGTDYRFSLDGGPPLPDPRSPYQPAGVHGPSRTVDHAAFGWSDAGFVAPPLESAVVYEVHVGTFSPAGTFDGVAARLDHLVDLGITHLSLMPVNEFPGQRGWGYDGVGLWAVQACYGGPDGLKRLVDACHARGLGVLLDVVYNHLGPDGNVLDQFGPYFTELYRTFWGPALPRSGGLRPGAALRLRQCGDVARRLSPGRAPSGCRARDLRSLGRAPVGAAGHRGRGARRAAWAPGSGRGE